MRRNFASLHLGEHIDAEKIAVDMNDPTAAKDLLLSRAEREERKIEKVCHQPPEWNEFTTNRST